LGTCITKCYMEKPAFTRACLSNIRVYPGDYVCTLGRVARLGGDGTDSCTLVPTTRCAWSLWPCTIILDNKCYRFLRPRRLVKIYLILGAPGWSDWVPRPILCWGGRRAGQTGGKILPAHIYHNERKDPVQISPGF
jgi:hypothetical protein